MRGESSRAQHVFYENRECGLCIMRNPGGKCTGSSQVLSCAAVDDYQGAGTMIALAVVGVLDAGLIILVSGFSVLQRRVR